MAVRDCPIHIEMAYSDYKTIHTNPMEGRDGPSHIERIHMWTTPPNPMRVWDGPTHIERVYSDSKITYPNTMVFLGMVQDVLKWKIRISKQPIPIPTNLGMLFQNCVKLTANNAPLRFNVFLTNSQWNERRNHRRLNEYTV